MIYIVSGNKGGIGKSFACKALIHYALARDNKKDIAIIDCDLSARDILKSCANKPRLELPKDEKDENMVINLMVSTGWEDLITWLDGHRIDDIIINTPATAGTGLIKYGSYLERALPLLNQNLILLWVISQDRDCLDSLRDYAAVFPKQKIIVIKNGYYGQEIDFGRWDESALQKQLKKVGGSSVYMTSLSWRAADQIHNDRLLLGEVQDQAKIKLGIKMSVMEWIRVNAEAFNAILGQEIKDKHGIDGKPVNRIEENE